MTESKDITSNEDRVRLARTRNPIRRCVYCYGRREVDACTDRLGLCCQECAEWDNNAQVVRESLPCICCGEELKPATGSENEGITVNTVDRHGFGDGMATRISCGYGSKLDCNVYMIALCDNCAKQKQEEGRLIFVYNSMQRADGTPNRC